MQKRLIIVFVLGIILLSSFVLAKQRLAGTTINFHQPSARLFIQKPFESLENGFEKRTILLSNFPQIADLRLRKADVSKVSLIRGLLQQTLDKKLYTSPDFKTLSCSGGIIFDKDRSMIRPLAELACSKDAQVPNIRNVGAGSAPFVTGSVVRKITGRATSSILSTPFSDCNDKLKEVASLTLAGILESERSLVGSDLEISTCGGLTTARQQFTQADKHLAAGRFASAINGYEDAWRKTVSCVCSSLG